MISRRFRAFQVVMFLFAFVLGGNTAYAATKADAVILAQDIMEATVTTREYKNAEGNDPYNAIMDVILNRQTGNLSTYIEMLAVKDDENIDLFKIFSDLSDMSNACLLYTSPSPRDKRQSRMPSSA